MKDELTERTDGHTRRKTDGIIDRQGDIKIDWEIYRLRNRRYERHRDSDRDIQTERESERKRETDRERQLERETDRQTERVLEGEWRY